MSDRENLRAVPADLPTHLVPLWRDIAQLYDAIFGYRVVLGPDYDVVPVMDADNPLAGLLRRAEESLAPFRARLHAANYDQEVTSGLSE